MIPFVCPRCGATAGRTGCDRCGHHAEVRDGVYRFVEAQNYADSFGYQWNQYASVQLDSANGTTISEDRFASVTGWTPEDLRGKTVLDAGAGSGRFTEIAIRWGAEVYAVDLSSAIFAARARVRDAERATFVQANCFDLPFPKRSFDFAFSIGVAQHTPDPLAFVRSVASMVRPGGRTAFWIYERTIPAFLHFKYMLRPLTKRLSSRATHALSSRLVDVFFPLATRARSLPAPVRRVFYRALPIAVYLDQLELPLEIQREWSELDTLDWYSPSYDNPQTFAAVAETLVQAGAKLVSRGAAAGLTAHAVF